LRAQHGLHDGREAEISNQTGQQRKTENPGNWGKNSHLTAFISTPYRKYLRGKLATRSKNTDSSVRCGFSALVDPVRPFYLSFQISQAGGKNEKAHIRYGGYSRASQHCWMRTSWQRQGATAGCYEGLTAQRPGM
jgi:hypothetical protein